MAVVSNTSPLNYLLLIDQIELLPQLFGRVVTPHAVIEELLHPGSPVVVRSWAAKPPAWIEVRSATVHPTPPLAPLDEGEREAIALALELDTKLVLIDELAARQEAEARGLQVIGTLGILDRAAGHGPFELREALERLRQTNFRVTEALIQSLLERDAAPPSSLPDPPRT
jgi:predicted nucleic acid-binding protein